MTEDEVLFRKQLDWSSFSWGFTIPIANHKRFFEHDGKRIERGEQISITLVHGNKEYTGIIGNVDRKVKSDTLRILYTSDDRFKKLLHKTFSHTHDYIVKERAKAMKEGAIRPQVKISKEESEYMVFQATGIPYRYSIEFIPLVSGVPIEPEPALELDDEIRVLVKEPKTFPFVPNIFNDLEDVSRGKVDMKKYHEKSAAALFEDMVFMAFRTLGFDESRQLGYKMPLKKRIAPDGELKSHNSDYLVIYDAKERASGYRMDTGDRRAMEEYVKRARMRNFKKVYCLMISSRYDDYPSPILGSPLTYLTVSRLLQILSFKIQDPENVNPLSLEFFFERAKVIDSEDIEEWIEEFEIRRISEADSVLRFPGLDRYF